MEKLSKHTLSIPVYYFEDENGYIILDEEEMKKTFDKKLTELYNNTKRAKHEKFNKKFEKSSK